MLFVKEVSQKIIYFIYLFMYVCMYVFIYLFILNVYLFFRERETEHEQGRAERDGDTETKGGSRL